jgi:hypothetical protein
MCSTWIEMSQRQSNACVAYFICCSIVQRRSASHDPAECLRSLPELRRTAILALSFHLLADDEAELHRCADSALTHCIAWVERGEPWTLTEAERTALEALLLVHDEQLASMPVDRYLEALEQVQHVGTMAFGLSIESA